MTQMIAIWTIASRNPPCTMLLQPATIGILRPSPLPLRRTPPPLRCLPPDDDIPESLDDSLAAACTSLRAVLGPKKQTKKKPKQPKSLRRLCVEIPVLDTSRRTLEYVAGGISLELSAQGPVSVVFDDASLANLPEEVPHAAMVATLSEAPRARLTSRLLVVGPSGSGLEAVAKLLEDVWRGELVVLLNPEWGEGDSAAGGLEGKFEVVYSFLPLAVQGFLGKKEGVLLKRVREKGESAKWRIFVKEGEGWKCVGQQAARPKDEQLELALYNAAAVDSPFSKGLRYLRGLGKG